MQNAINELARKFNAEFEVKKEWIKTPKFQHEYYTINGEPLTQINIHKYKSWLKNAGAKPHNLAALFAVILRRIEWLNYYNSKKNCQN